MTQCTAKSKRSGAQCKRGAVEGNTKCHIHGGKSLGGMASPTTKTGRYSKYLPERLMGRYQEAKADVELLGLRDDVALLDARLAELLGRVDTGESAQRWQQAQDAFGALRLARGKADEKAFSVAFDELERALIAGDDFGLWHEITSALNMRKQLVESERKRLVEMQQMITSERAMVLLANVVGIIKEHVTDRSILATISAEFRKLAMVESGE